MEKDAFKLWFAMYEYTVTLWTIELSATLQRQIAKKKFIQVTRDVSSAFPGSVHVIIFEQNINNWEMPYQRNKQTKKQICTYDFYSF